MNPVASFRSCPWRVPVLPQAALVGLPIGGASPLGSHQCIDALNPTLPFLG